MVELLVVVGAGGFGRETLDVAKAMNAASGQPVWNILGVVDDDPSELNLQRLADRDVAHLGPVSGFPADAKAAIGIGLPAARRSVRAELQARGIEFATLIHPTAVVGSQVRIGSGGIVCADVSVGTNATLGDQVHLNAHAVIGHDATLGDFVSINPNATVSGDCTIEAGVLIGAAAVILQGLIVGADATVGAAACATKNIHHDQVVKGVPAR